MATLQSLIPVVSTLCLLVACGEQPLEPDFEERLADGAADLAVPPTSTYYIVTHVDFRDCAFPTCGGVFVREVNKKKTTCADGTTAEECHAAVTDFSALGLSPYELAQLEQSWEGSEVLVRGELFVDGGGAYDPGLPINTLEASEAWAGVTASDPVGSFVRLDDSGIVCVTFPCPIFVGRLLNSGATKELAGVDLAASGATPAQVTAGFDELYASGLLAVGTPTTVTGPAGSAAGFAASEFYSRVVAAGQ